jgi:hypothetical protein
MEVIQECKEWRESHATDLNNPLAYNPNYCVAKDALKEHLKNCPNTRPQPCGDAVQVWVVYKVEDDSHHIFSTKENADRFSQETTEPTVIYDYIIDHPERYYERTN